MYRSCGGYEPLFLLCDHGLDEVVCQEVAKNVVHAICGNFKMFSQSLLRILSSTII